MGRHSKPEDSATRIGEARLVELREAGGSAGRAAGGFVDPSTLQQCLGVLDRRGEQWAAAVLGRNITQRSLTDAKRPYLRTGEDHTLVAADAEEDRISIAHLDGSD